MNERFQQATAVIPALFKQLADSELFLAKGIASQRGRPGIYIFFENGRAVHVGRTRNLQARLRGHVSRSHYSASFAFKRARRALNIDATYRTEGSRGRLSADEIFGPEFHRQIELIRAMEVRFIEVADPVQQYLLELYAHMEYDLPLDEFDTH
jgi:hypothetical protein